MIKISKRESKYIRQKGLGHYISTTGNRQSYLAENQLTFKCLEEYYNNKIKK